MQAVYYIPVNNTLLEVQSPFLAGAKAVLIENHSGDNIAFDNDTDPVFLIPPGITVPMNLDHLTYTLRFRTATNTTGSAKVTVYDNQIDTSRAPALQQLPGGISITGSVTIPSAVTVTGSVTSSDAAAQSLLTDLKNLIGTTNTLDTDIKTLITVLTGLLPANIVTVSIAAGASTAFNTTAAKAVTQFALDVQGFNVTGYHHSGFLTVWVAASGQTQYLLYRHAFDGRQTNDDVMIEETFNAPIPAGGTINLLWEQALTAFTGLLKF